MRSLAIVCLLIAATAVADGTKFQTTVTVRVDDDNKALNASFTDAVGTPDGTRVDGCWKRPGKLHAKVVFEQGKATSVEVTAGGDRDVDACVAKVLRALTLPNTTSRATAVVDLAGTRPQPPPHERPVGLLDDSPKNRKVLDMIIDRNLSTNLSKFAGISGGGSGAGGTGVVGIGVGTGVGSGRGFGTGVVGTGTGGGGGPGGAGKVADRGTEPKVAMGSSLVDSSDLTAAEIDRVVKSHAGVFRACYQKELARDPKIAGKLVIKFRIAADGSVTSASVGSGSSLKSEPLETCVKSQVMRLKFPAKGVADVTYPIILSPGA